MKPGRELDALVAEKVMKLHYIVGCSYIFNGKLLGKETVPHYSTNIYAAWQIVEELYPENDNDLIFKVCRNVTDKGWDWACHFKVGGTVFGETAPHAICLAALEAVGVSV